MNRHAGARPRDDRRAEACAEILEAAASAIAEHGYHGMSMRDLARATGRGLANFYNYFSSKEELLFAIQSYAFETLNATVEKALAGIRRPADRLYAFIYNHLRYVAEHRAVMRVLVHEASALPPARRKAVRELKERYFRIGQGIVSSILKEGCKNPASGSAHAVRADELERTTYSIFGMLNWSYGWYDPKRHGTPHDVACTIHGIALCGMVAHCPYRAVPKVVQRYLESFVSPPLIGIPVRNGKVRREGRDDKASF